jgi:hypothetical protein
MDTVQRMAETAHQQGTDSMDFQEAYADWILELEAQPTHRPPVELRITRNGIELWLQWAVGSEYKYVPPDKYVADQFCMELQTSRDRIMTEITTGKKAKQELRLIEAGIIQPEEGHSYEDDDGYLTEEEHTDVDDLVVIS